MTLVLVDHNMEGQAVLLLVTLATQDRTEAGVNELRTWERGRLARLFA